MLTEADFGTIIAALRSEDHFLEAVEAHGMDTSSQRAAVLATKAKVLSLKDKLIERPVAPEGPKPVD